MSRIGSKPIKIPAGVTITVNGTEVVVKGPKGELKQNIVGGITITQEDKANGDQPIKAVINNGEAPELSQKKDGNKSSKHDKHSKHHKKKHV